MEKSEKNKLDWIQALRGIAVVLVMLSHARYFFMSTSDWPLMEKIFRPGAMGVDLFFIISGFVMVHTTRNLGPSPAYSIEFLIKRFARVWPPYAVAALLSVLITHHGLRYFHQPDNAAVFFKSLLLMPVDVSIPPFYGFAMPVAWTLAFEMYFYVVFSISMLFGRGRWVMLYAWLTTTAIIVPFALGNKALDVAVQLNWSNSYVNLMTNPIIADFLAGVFIAQIYLLPVVRLSSHKLCHHFLWGGIGLALWCNFTTVAEFHGPTKWGAPLMLMVFCMAIASKTITLVTPRLLVWLGTISYSIYLLHTSVQFGISLMLDRQDITGDLWGRIFITSLATVMVSALSYLYLETWLSNRIRTGLESVAARVSTSLAIYSEASK